MPPVVKANEQNNLVETKAYPYAKFPFDAFNPVQSRLFEFYEKDANFLIASSTASGKTCCAEMVLAHEIRKRGGKGMYLVPLKALANEKIDDWTDKDHHFGDLKISVCTGDYRLTAERKKELEEADLIIATYEMLAHRVRNNKTERSKFLEDVKTLVIDEFHMCGDISRGNHIEMALMKFTELNKEARIVALSATMPNTDELSDWISYVLTKKDTYLLSSKYRPCKLIMHYEQYWDGERSYDDNEKQKVNSALQIVEYYPDDKFIVFVHTKKAGELMKTALTNAKIKCEFHNADLDKAKRRKLENEFKTNPDLRVVVATSTLAAGINMPARRVIVLGVHRGLEEVSAADIVQECGRAGRPAYDTIGDAYVLLPETTFEMQKERIKNVLPIKSQMLDNTGGKHRALAFHIVSEVNQGDITDKDEVHYWYKRSLASFQSHELTDQTVDDTIELLKKYGAVWEENDKYTATSVGKIASLFYFSPFDVSDLKRNFSILFDKDKQEDDHWLAISLANIDTHKLGIVSRNEREQMSSFVYKIRSIFGDSIAEPALKAAYVYYLLLNGSKNEAFIAMSRNLQLDFPRTNQVLHALDSFGGKWNRRKWLNELQLRVQYGVKGPMVYLCQIPNIGKVRANKLWGAGLKTVSDVVNNPGVASAALGLKESMMEEVMNGARAILFKENA